MNELNARLDKWTEVIEGKIAKLHEALLEIGKGTLGALERVGAVEDDMMDLRQELDDSNKDLDALLEKICDRIECLENMHDAASEVSNPKPTIWQSLDY